MYSDWLYALKEIGYVKTPGADAFSFQSVLIVIIMTIARKQNAKAFVMRSVVSDGGIKKTLNYNSV